jgi:hypothetical protein
VRYLASRSCPLGGEGHPRLFPIEREWVNPRL